MSLDDRIPFIAERYERARDYLNDLRRELEEMGERGIRAPTASDRDENPGRVDALLRLCEAMDDGGSGDPQVDYQVQSRLDTWYFFADRGKPFLFDLYDLEKMAIVLNKYCKRKLG
jgi:hypothetical protein